MKVKDIKQDEVGMAIESFGSSAAEFGKKNRTPLIAGLAAVALVAAGVSGYRWMKQSQEAAAQTEYSVAADMADGIDNPPAPVEGQEPEKQATWAEVATAFEKVAADHPGTIAGELAGYQAGVAQLRAGDAAKAAATLAAFESKHPKSWAAPHALSVAATASEQGGDLAAAEASLVKLKDTEYATYPPADALARLAEFYDRHDRAADAKPLWTALAEDAKYTGTAAQGAAKMKAGG